MQISLKKHILIPSWCINFSSLCKIFFILITFWDFRVSSVSISLIRYYYKKSEHINLHNFSNTKQIGFVPNLFTPAPFNATLKMFHSYYLKRKLIAHTFIALRYTIRCRWWKLPISLYRFSVSTSNFSSFALPFFACNLVHKFKGWLFMVYDDNNICLLDLFSSRVLFNNNIFMHFHSSFYSFKGFKKFSLNIFLFLPLNCQTKCNQVENSISVSVLHNQKKT